MSEEFPPGLALLIRGLAPPFFGLFSAATYKAFFGGRGSGKSYAAIVVLVALCYSRKLRIACAREFMVTLSQSVRELIVGVIFAAGCQDDWIIEASWIGHKRTGAHFFFIGLARNPDSIKSLEGVDICLVEEAQTISALSLEYLIPTIRKVGSEVWFIWNPRNKTDQVDEMFRGKFPPKSAIVQRVSWRDNPVFGNTPMMAAMKRDKRRDKATYQHIWEGEYRNASGAAILTNWSEGVIELPPAARPLFGLDWGFDPDPTALSKCYDLPNNVLYINAEAYEHRIHEAKMPAFLDRVSETRRYPIIADSSDPRMISAMVKAGFRVQKATKGPGSIDSGISFLQGRDIVINPACENAVREAGAWSWKLDKKTGKPIVGEPADGDDHFWDATRYATESLMRAPLRVRVHTEAPPLPLIRPRPQ